MSSTIQRIFKNYGVGVGLRVPHYPTFLNAETRPRSVDWIEVVSENFMGGRQLYNSRANRVLEKVRRDYPVALHGVSLSIGSMHGLDLEYLKKLKLLVDRVQPIVVSDHLCWTRVHGVQTHDLNPLPYTQKLVDQVAGKIKQVQDFLGRQILIENVSSYVEFEQSTLSEEDFISLLVERADCGVLLDINNVYVSARNHGFDAKGFLSRIPHHRVGQIHIAGHSEKNGFIIDTHDRSVRDEVWELFHWYGKMFGHPSSMIERDGDVPLWGELEVEVIKLKSLFVPRDSIELSADNGLASSPRAHESLYSEKNQQQWAQSLFDSFAVEGIRGHGVKNAQERFEIYANAFWLRVADALEADFIEFKAAVGSEWMSIVKRVLTQAPPNSWSVAELSQLFVDELKTDKHPYAHLAERDWAKNLVFYRTDLVHEDVESDFSRLSELDEVDLMRVTLALHPSAQAVESQKEVFWADSERQIAEKLFSEEDWSGMLMVLNQTPFLQLEGHEAAVQEWVQIGLVTGWRRNKAHDSQKKPQTRD